MEQKEIENHIKRIVIRVPNWIGDAVMATASIEALIKLFPQASIYIAARPWVASVFKAHKGIKGIIELEYQEKTTLKGLITNAKKIKSKDFDLALILPNSIESALVTFLARVPIRIGHNSQGRSLFLTHSVKVPEFKKTRHEVFYYLNLVSYIERYILKKSQTSISLYSKEIGSPALKLYVDKKSLDSSKLLLKKLNIDLNKGLIGFNPGAAYGPAKCWPTDKFRELAGLISKNLSHSILVFGTKREIPIAQEICKASSKVYSLCGKTSLSEAIALISKLNLMVTNDSGLMHVAAALDIPSIAIFGSTNPITTGPWSKKAIVVRKELECSPCLKRQCPRKDMDFACMKQISVEEVFKQVKIFL